MKKSSGQLPARIDRYAIFFAEMDTHFIAPEEIDQRRLFEIFGAEGLRRGFLIVSFLCERLALPWSAEVMEDLVEERRICQLMQRWADQPWAAHLQLYLESIQQRTKLLKRKTVRTYITYAGQLMEEAKVDEPSALRQVHIDQFLRRCPGGAASLRSFVSYLKTGFGIELQLKTKKKTSSVKQEKMLIERVRLLFRGLESAGDGRSAQALLAELLSKLYGLPLNQVLRLSSKDIVESGDSYLLWPDKLDVGLKGPVVEHFKRWLHILPDRRYVFEGRNAQQPLSQTAVKYHLRALESMK